MSTLKRCISLLLVLGILFGVLAPAAQAAPVEDAASVNTDNVTIEGTNGFGNLLAQEITEDQQESETENGAYSGGYSVTDLEIVDNVATVSYNSMEEAQLVVALHTEDGMQLLTSATVIVTPDATEATVTFEGEMPEYFMASAYLLDRYDYSPLCASYDTPMYTREMQALLASTVNDYDPEKVLNLDEDETTNFAVYADSTIVIEAVEGINTVASIDDENATYVIKNADEQVTSLAEGNVFVYPYAEEEILIVKVADIKVDGTVVTITGDELEMEEVFAYLKLETEADLDNAEVDNSELDEGVEYIGIEYEQGDVQPAAYDGTGELTKAYKWKVSWDNDAGSELNISLKYTLGVEVDYYISLSYTRIELSLMNKVNVTGEIKSGLETAPIPMEARLSRISIPFLGGAAAVEFTPSFVAEFSVSVKVDAEIKAEIGFYFDNHSCRPTYSSSCKGFELEAEGELFVGLKLTPEIEVLGGTVVEAKLTGKIGAQLSCKAYPRELDEKADVIHECEGCLDGDISLIVEMKASLKVLGKNALKNALKYQTSHELTFLDFKWKFADFYICYEHGKFLAWGVCPNNLYRTTVCVTDRDENPIPDAEVTVGDQTQMTDKNGIAVFYLRYLEYTVEAEYGELMNRRTIMANKAQKVKIPLYEGVESEGFFGFNEGIITDSGLLVNSGTCGENAYWTLYGSGLLEITGSGAMFNYSIGNAPWYSHKDDICSIKVADGITYIGMYAFYECLQLEVVNISSSVEEIGMVSFGKCPKLEEIVIPEGTKIIGMSAFNSCGKLKTAYLPKSLTYIETFAFYLAGLNDIYYAGSEEQWRKISTGSSTGIGGATLHYNSSYAMNKSVVPNAVYPGDYDTEITDSVVTKTASFSKLVPGEQYVMLAMVSIDVENLLEAENLLAIDQGVASEDGTLSFQYIQRTPYEVSYVVACGASNKNLNEAVITFPEMTEDSELHVVNPTVEYDGKTLTEGLDYIITGTVAYAERGEYTCYIRGIYNYTGLVECAYTVDAHEHSFTTYVSDGNATCTEDGTKTAKCDHCDATDTIPDVGSALGHSWDKGVVTREPTEDTEGERLYTCTACGATKAESIPVIGHEHHYEAVVTTPTCTERGYTTHTCAACGDSYITDELPALGHDWHGTKCSRCDETRRNPFVDVADDSFCIDAVLWAVEKGITKGITDTRFAPDDLTTRGQIVTFLWRAAGEPEPASNANPFTDVKGEDFCYKAVLWAVENGITKGMTETIFAPNSSCTRAQAVTFLHRYMGKPAYTITSSGFTDVTDPKEFCYDAILWAVENGITGGLGDGTFGVDQTCTRGQIVTFLYRTLA